ncbi:putative methyltransferase YcgJ [Tsuneonella dongtanensis]|uniref:Putative methyltransferase YcgJ n=1 Tax=Tsuneonella dongtanensis TaxID=692370 RepID=A0A1B2AAN4_9SPHN|nr:class I SAM-dependent methyltransferase [Tsuneonella dongtanensis]ANY19230.1 putative methyltransferase YcgJ [Tsuneonella dongtanensis]
MNAPLYDTIGLDYANLRRPDPRIAAAIETALGDARKVLNVGAGAGSYEPSDREVTALEPSAEMIAQRPAGAAPCVQGVAEALPFEDDSFDAVMGVMTVHHWTDRAAGFAELRRVSRGTIVLCTFDPLAGVQWVLDYFPEMAELDRQFMPTMEEYVERLGAVEISPLPVPHDCTDGFLYAYWRRPEAYLDPLVRKAISSFWLIERVEEGLERLKADLADGTWKARYGHLLGRDSIDAGYRLVVSRG